MANFLIKKEKLRLKMHSPLWFLYVKLKRSFVPFSLVSCPRLCSVTGDKPLVAFRPTGLSCRHEDRQMPVTRVLSRCLGAMGFGRTTEIWRAESNSHSETLPSTWALPWVHKWRTSLLSSASRVSSSLRRRRACSRWLLIKEAMSLLFPKEKYVPSRTKGILNWKGEKRVIVLCYKTSAWVYSI